MTDRDDFGRALPPMPSQYVVTATVRNDRPVFRLEMIDVVGEKQVIDVDPELGFSLALELLNFYRAVT